MGIRKSNEMFPRIIGATCDCCDKEFKLDMIGRLPNHMILSGHQGSMNLESIICMECIEEKFNFVKINKTPNTIGYC